MKKTALFVSIVLILCFICSCSGNTATTGGYGAYGSVNLDAQSDFQRKDADVTEAKIVTVGNIPRLYIDGKNTAPLFFWGNTSFTFGSQATMSSQIDLATRSGVSIIMTEVNFATMVDDEVYDFAPIDSKLNYILQRNPDAKIMIRISPSTGKSMFWEDLFPGDAKRFEDGTRADSVSFASEQRVTYAVNAAKALVEHILSNKKYSNSVIGYHYGYGEWFQSTQEDVDFSRAMLKCYKEYVKEKYGTVEELRKAWGDDSVDFDNITIKAPPGSSLTSAVDYNTMKLPEDQRFVDYYEALNYNAADIICLLAKTIKEASGGRSLFMTFYGYAWEVPGPKSAHNGLTKILEDENVDIISSPLTYNDRMEGGTGGLMSLADSLAAHNKLWVMENDLRTLDSNVSVYEEPDAEYNLKTESEESAIEIQKREFGLILSRNIGMYWMDLWGTGWQNNSAYWNEYEKMIKLYNDYAASFDGFKPDVAVVVDESSVNMISNTTTFVENMFYKQKNIFYSAGVTFGLYETSVAVSDYVDAKLYIFLNPWDISDKEAENIKKNIIDKGKTVLWVNGFGRQSAEKIKELTGMNIKHKDETETLCTVLATSEHPIIDELSGKIQIFNDETANPYFYVEDDTAVTLGKYDLNGLVSFAAKETNGYKSVFYGGTLLTESIVRAVAKYAGANIFIDTNDTLTGNHNFISVHAATAGEKTIKLPMKTDVYDYYEEKWYSGVESINVSMEKGQTKFFFFGNKAQIKKVGIAK
ncbi:MAG: hypothetical protein E7480_04660 [Ruminococcaceae bacterium]|nr:hypothetical protein [Oscillospiraceae bacterium]